MFEPGERKRPFIIDSFPVASHKINELMPLLLTAINEQPILRQRLFQMEFLTTLSGDALVSLIYHKKLDDDWEDAARALAQSLNLAMVGRSRKQKRVLGRDFVLEERSEEHTSELQSRGHLVC